MFSFIFYPFTHFHIWLSIIVISFVLSLPISRFGSQIIQPLFHLLVFFVTLLHLSLAPLYLATATSLSLSFPLSLTPPLFRLCPPFLPPTPLCRCASCVMSQGLISGGQPLSRWQPEQQLPGGWARGWWWWGGWLQCCCISRWKWARTKENQLSAACYVLPVWATVWHTQAASLLCGFSSVAVGAVCVMVQICGISTREHHCLWFRKWHPCLPIWHTSTTAAWRKQSQRGFPPYVEETAI